MVGGVWFYGWRRGWGWVRECWDGISLCLWFIVRRMWVVGFWDDASCSWG